MICVAKSGFLFAKPISNYFNCDMADIVAVRPASGAKDRLKFFIKLIPERMLLAILGSPLMYGLNEKKSDREIIETPRYQEARKKRYKKILIVDDSADTGWTLKAVREHVQTDYPTAIIKTACYCVIDKSKSRVKVDYWKYENAVVLTATSRRSPEYEAFLKAYEAWSAGGTAI